MSAIYSFRGGHGFRKRPPGKVAPLAAAITLCLVGSAHAATIVVNDPTADSVVNMCTIVDAVTALNTQLPVNDCIAGDGANDTIDLTGFTTPTTITFTTAPGGTSHALSLNIVATIKGALDSTGAPYVTLERSSVTGTPDFGLIRTGATLTVYGLALRNGSAPAGYLGGAIRAGGALTVNNSVISGNTAVAGGAIGATNAVTLYRSTVSGNTAENSGGGIYSNSSVYAYLSTVSDNMTTSSTGGGGAGIYSFGVVHANGSIISANISASKAGGIYSNNLVNLSASTVSGNAAQAGAGGGVVAMNNGLSATGSTFDGNTATTKGGAVYTTDAELTNSTITGNAASDSGGGVYAHTATLNYCTIFTNTATMGIGGGLDFAMSATANATILFGNMPEDVNTGINATLSGSYNLIASSGSGVPADTINCDPMLGTLGSNGGPTKTVPLSSGSCAIDAASAAPTTTTDQRGYLRPALIGATPRSDIGAFESGSHDPDTVFANGFE